MSYTIKTLTGKDLCITDSCEWKNIIYPVTLTDAVYFQPNGLTLNEWITNDTDGTVYTSLLQWLQVNYPGTSYTLPVATSSTLGGIKLGDDNQYLSIDENGVLTFTGTLSVDDATFTDNGILQLGNDTVIPTTFTNTTIEDTVTSISQGGESYAFPLRIDSNRHGGILIPTSLFSAGLVAGDHINITDNTISSDNWYLDYNKDMVSYNNKQIFVMGTNTVINSDATPTIGLLEGSNITFDVNTIPAGTFTDQTYDITAVTINSTGSSGSYSAGTNIDISNNIISSVSWYLDYISSEDEFYDTTSTTTGKQLFLLGTNNTTSITGTAVGGKIGLVAGNNITFNPTSGEDSQGNSILGLEIIASGTVTTTVDWEDILNKPTIPTVNDNTVSIYSGTTLLDSFTLNQSSDKVITLPSSSYTAGDNITIDNNVISANSWYLDYDKNKATFYNSQGVSTNQQMFLMGTNNSTTLTGSAVGTKYAIVAGDNITMNVSNGQDGSGNDILGIILSSSSYTAGNYVDIDDNVITPTEFIQIRNEFSSTEVTGIDDGLTENHLIDPSGGYFTCLDNTLTFIHDGNNYKVAEYILSAPSTITRTSYSDSGSAYQSRYSFSETPTAAKFMPNSIIGFNFGSDLTGKTIRVTTKTDIYTGSLTIDNTTTAYDGIMLVGDANNFKIRLTKSDSDSLVYVEIEQIGASTNYEFTLS